MGTVPSLVVPSLPQPLTDSRDVLAHLDSLKPTNPLIPSDAKAKATMQVIIDLVHGDDVSTNLILLQARDMEEYEGKRDGPFGAYIATRQNVLEKHRAAYPEHGFYGPKAQENGVLHNIYTKGSEEEREAFFKDTHVAYGKFAEEMDRLESLIVLPYAVGEEVSLADLNAVPWLAHALAGVGTTEIKDLSKLEAHLRKSVPGFKIGEKTKKWWENYTEREAFKEVFPVLH
jgi:glutathione S-transferase